MAKADIEGLTLHFQRVGIGQDLVMIHGLISNLAFWYLTIAHVLARDFRVTVYDLRGHGLSDMPRNGYTSSDMALDLNRLLNHLGIERAHLVGHSFGGAVALHHAAAYPDRVLSLTLADARVPCLQPAFPPRDAARWSRLRIRLSEAGIDVPKDLPRVAYSYFEEIARLRRRRRHREANSLITGALLSPWSGNSRAVSRWAELVRTTTAPSDLRSKAGLTIHRIRQVAHPTLAIFGEYSDCRATLKGLVENLRNCVKVVVPGVGHFHPIVRPRSFVRNFREFALGTRA
jgi:pimeloyl-ACP methyl ester carboxylesterase